MIILTGAAGFIGSCTAKKLNSEGFNDLILVDEFSRPEKNRNLKGKGFQLKFHRGIFLNWWEKNTPNIDLVIHLGARTDTTEKDQVIFDRLNLNYSKTIWNICAKRQIPLIYASSAATYGLGEFGYDDRHDIVPQLKPLNPYGQSKNDFDEWTLQQEKTPPFWAGLKFFNVYGPNEYHKGRMASVIFHTLNQINNTGGMKLFRSHRPNIADGYQSRDFVYVKDVVEVIHFFAQNYSTVSSGLYNLGTGKARTFLDLVNATFQAMGKTPKVSFIDTPADIRDTYQYFTKANMEKLRSVGYAKPFHTLEEGIADYVKGHLLKEQIW